MHNPQETTHHKPADHEYLLKVEGPEGLEKRFSRYEPALASKVVDTKLPEYTDLRSYCSPIESQGKLGSCSGHALTAAIEYLENKLSMFDGDNDQFLEVSRLFTYYNERVIGNTVNMDTGAKLSDGIKTLATHGVCRESLWPYDPALLKQKPSEEAYKDALSRRITGYSKVCLGSINDIKRVLHSGFPIVFGMIIYQSFESVEVASTGTVNMPVSGERCLGGHAVMIVGHNDATQQVLVRNSWGAGWGMNGYFTLPYAYVTHGRLASDAWVIHN